MEEAPDTLIDFGNAPEIYADGIFDAQVVPPNGRFIFFKWRKIEGIWRQVLAGSVERPLVSFDQRWTLRLQSTTMRDGPPMIERRLHS